MGEVIHYNFGRSACTALVPVQTTTSVLGIEKDLLLFGYDDERAAEDCLYIDENCDRIRYVSTYVKNMYEYIFVSKQHPLKKHGIERYRRGVHDYPMEDLCRTIMGSQSPQWNSMSNYHGALVLEFEARIYQASERWSAIALR